MLIGEEKEPDIGENTVLKFLQKNFRTTSKLDGHNFFTKDKDKKSGKAVWVMTPLFVSLVMVEIADVVFAVDSVPAIFAITKDPYIVYTSNIFAILGLRALYFALAAMIHRFEYLKYALAMVLIFIGSKMFFVDMLGLTKFPPLLSLAVTIAILIGGVLFSLWKTHKAGKAWRCGSTLLI
jgi:tellurite resistance protein TerC